MKKEIQIGIFFILSLCLVSIVTRRKQLSTETLFMSVLREKEFLSIFDFISQKYENQEIYQSIMGKYRENRISFFVISGMFSHFVIFSNVCISVSYVSYVSDVLIIYDS